MKKSRFSETKIVSVLGRNERGLKVKDLWREHGISDAAFYK
jgi:putative transposase